MIIRESVLGRAIFAFTGASWLTFALLCSLYGDEVTSKQWVYLMSVPGGKWFWACTFGIGSAAALIGTIRRRHALTATGLFIVATCSLLIFAFYLLAPLIDPGLMTLGFMVWFFGSALTYLFAAFNVTAVTWF